VQVSDTAVLFTGQNIFARTRDGKPVEAPARFTFLIVKEADGWRVGHFHSSRRPRAQ
jgi:ketosteroid isomerase-like protein